jgi:hypothetical protein
MTITIIIVRISKIRFIDSVISFVRIAQTQYSHIFYIQCTIHRLHAAIYQPIRENLGHL